MKLRTLLVAGLVAGSMTISGAALAAGPGGSTESTDDPVTAENEGNQVTCGASPIEAPNGVTVGASATGIETCSDSADAPIQGRVIVSSDNGGYIAVDGDADNAQHNESLTGYILLSRGAQGCGPTGGGDASAPGAVASPQNCQPGE